MDFGEAIRLLKQGKQVQRAGWNGRGMHVYLEDAHSMTIGGGAFRGERRITAPYMVLYTAQGVHQPGWNASTPDVLADDWQEVAS